MNVGIAALNAHIEKLLELDRSFVRLAAQEAAPLVKEALQRTAGAGKDPNGTAWAPRKEDGGRAYANAADRIDVRAVANIVLVGLSGPEVFGQFTKRKGMPKRASIPYLSGELPPTVAEACREGARRAFAKLMGGST